MPRRPRLLPLPVGLGVEPWGHCLLVKELSLLCPVLQKPGVLAVCHQQVSGLGRVLGMCTATAAPFFSAGLRVWK